MVQINLALVFRIKGDFKCAPRGQSAPVLIGLPARSLRFGALAAVALVAASHASAYCIVHTRAPTATQVPPEQAIQRDAGTAGAIHTYSYKTARAKQL